MFLSNRWTIDTKYYSADLSIWMAHLDDEFSLSSLPVSKHLDALVMVFDLSDVSIASLSLLSFFHSVKALPSIRSFKYF